MKTAIVTFLLVFLIGQNQITLNTEESSLKVLGTSTVHDWESLVEDFSVTGQMDQGTISNLKVTVKTTSIKSGKSVMDDKTYEALKAPKFPEITFASPKMTIAGQKVTGEGTLTLAGSSKKIQLTSDIISQTATSMKLKGSVAMKMSDFGIDAPTAMFGSIRTGDEVTIQYEILLNNK